MILFAKVSKIPVSFNFYENFFYSLSPSLSQKKNNDLKYAITQFEVNLYECNSELAYKTSNSSVKNLLYLKETVM